MFQTAQTDMDNLMVRLGHEPVQNAKDMIAHVNKLTSHFPKIRAAASVHGALQTNFEEKTKAYLENYQTAIGKILQTSYQWQKLSSDECQRLTRELAIQKTENAKLVNKCNDNADKANKA